MRKFFLSIRGGDNVLVAVLLIMWTPILSPAVLQPVLVLSPWSFISLVAIAPRSSVLALATLG